MKGLVFKDLLLMKKMNKKVIFVMYFFVIAISFFGENEVYSIMSSAFFSLFIAKIEASANKYTFVWKKAVTKTRQNFCRNLLILWLSVSCFMI